MPTARRLRTLSAVVAAFFLAVPVSAQASSSESFVVSSPEIASGGPAAGTTLNAVASFGIDVTPCPASSPRWRIVGGFPSHFQSRLGGSPWLIAGCPTYFPLLGGVPIEFRGDEFHLGSSAVATVGGKTARVLGRTRVKVRVRAPTQDAPGWQRAAVRNGGGAASLTRAFGVLPMLDLNKAPCRTAPFDLIYRGTRGDLVIWTFALGRLNRPVAAAPFLYGALLDPGTFGILVATVVPSADGVQRLPIPALGLVPRIWLQSLAISTNVGYRPGSFTNAISIF